MKNRDCTHFLWGTASVDGWVHKDPSEFEIILNTKLQLGYSNSTFTRYLSENANVHLSSRTIRQVERLQFWKIWTFKFQPNPLEPLLSAGLWLDASQNNNKGQKYGRDWMKKVRTLFHPIGGLPTTMMPSHATWGADDMIADDCIVKYEVQDLFGYRSAP